MKKFFVIGFILFIGFFPICAGADLIDFESGGYAEGDRVGTIMTDTNQVSFYSTKNVSGGVFTAEIAEVGDPRFAFKTGEGIQGDTLINVPIGWNAGSFFLTDDNPQASPESYFIQFFSPVSDISLGLYDFDAELWGEDPIDHYATLTAFSGVNWTEMVGSCLVPLGSDGSVIVLSIPNPSSHILSASLTFDPINSDSGTGIDNISFNTVPIPAAAWLLGSGLIAMVGIRRKFTK